MTIFDPIAQEDPNPDCAKCGGEGVDQYPGTAFSQEVFKACPHCWKKEDQPHD